MRNNYYFISRAETSSTEEGRRREQPISFFVLSYKAAFRGDTGVKCFDDAADAALLSGVRSLLADTL